MECASNNNMQKLSYSVAIQKKKKKEKKKKSVKSTLAYPTNQQFTSSRAMAFGRIFHAWHFQ